MEIFGAVGGIAVFIFAVIAVLAPVWLYFINVYTADTRSELRKLNKTMGMVLDLLQSQDEQKRIETPIERPAGDLIEMNCPECRKKLKYDSKHSGKYRACPECKKAILLK